jgi:hypothetical protein
MSYIINFVPVKTQSRYRSVIRVYHAVFTVSRVSLNKTKNVAYLTVRVGKCLKTVPSFKKEIYFSVLTQHDV